MKYSILYNRLILKQMLLLSSVYSMGNSGFYPLGYLPKADKKRQAVASYLSAAWSEGTISSHAPLQRLQ